MGGIITIHLDGIASFLPLREPNHGPGFSGCSGYLRPVCILVVVNGCKEKSVRQHVRHVSEHHNYV